MIHKIIGLMALNFFSYEDWVEYFFENEIEPNDWPDCEAKFQVLKYKQLVDSGRSREYAWAQSVDFITKLESEDFSNLPTAANQIFALYQDEIIKHKANEVIGMIRRNPLKLNDIMSNYDFCKNSKKGFKLLTKTGLVAMERAIESSQKKESIKHIPGFENLSQLVGGFNPGRVGMLIAVTGFGKTNFAVSLANAITKKYSVAFANMEMSEQDFVEKVIMCANSITFKEMKENASKYGDRTVEWLSGISRRGVEFYYTPGNTSSVAELRQYCLSYKKTDSKLDFLIVDYDQKISVTTSRDMPEWKALQIAVEQLESLAKELNMFVLLLAQEVEGDVGGSKRSKNPASFVLKFARRKNIDITNFDKAGKEQDYIQVVKNRFGPGRKILEVIYTPEMARVVETDRFLDEQK